MKVLRSRIRLPGRLQRGLRSAMRQPVDWQEWGEEAFAKAEAEDKPILLDIGAVWCHWCHVMDRESYENAETARIINDLFVAVKVDRDERPDVDTRYQAAVSAISGQGGWPLTAFLTPEGKPLLWRDQVFSADGSAWAARISASAADDGRGVSEAARGGERFGRKRDGGDRA